MLALALAGGLIAGDRAVHLPPFQTQVSERSAVTERPPKRTMLPVALSNAIAASRRAEGFVTGDAAVHVDPFHCHVSDRSPLAPLPPNRTSEPDAGSNPIDAPD